MAYEILRRPATPPPIVRSRSSSLPRLTRLDQRVLDRLPGDRSVRRAAIVVEMLAASNISKQRLNPDVYEPKRVALDTDVRGILRGLGHLGLAEHRGGGWWRRVPS